MNKKIIGVVAGMALAAQCMVGGMCISASAESANLCLDGDFEKYTDGQVIGENSDGYWKFWGNSGNTAIYSTEAAYGENSGLGVKITGTGTGDCQFNCDIPGFDISKTYTIEFDERVDGEAWSGRFSMLDYGWGYMFTDGDENNQIFLTPNEWTHYSFIIGPENADHTVISTALSNGAHVRFSLATAGTMYIDNISIKSNSEEPVTPEITGSNLIADTTFENHTDAESIPSDVNYGAWKFYNSNNDAETIAQYSAEAAYGDNSNIGIKVVKSPTAGTVQLNNELNNFDPANIYKVSFDANTNGKNWAARFKIKNSEYAEILKSGKSNYNNGVWLSDGWSSFSYIIGPTGTPNADYTFDVEDVINKFVTLQFSMEDSDTLYIDNFSVIKVDADNSLNLNLTWVNGDNKVISELSDGTVKCCAKVNNTYDEDKSLQIIIAKYSSEGELISSRVEPVEIIDKDKNDTIYTEPYQYTKTNDGEYLKAFAWETSLYPFTMALPLK